MATVIPTVEDLEKSIKAMKPNTWLADGAPRGKGTLTFYTSRSGSVSAYFRYTTSAGKTDRIPLGAYDLEGKEAFTVKELRVKAGELSRMYQEVTHDLRAHFEAETRAKVEAEEQAKAEAEAARAEVARQAEERQRFTLRKLCESYGALLASEGKVSAADVMSGFRNHVFTDKISDLPAKEITSEQVASLVRRVREKGHERMAGVLRANLNTAFKKAVQAKFDSKIPVAFADFGVTQNPVSVLPAHQGIRAGERVLTREELRKYLVRLFSDHLADQVLMLNLLAGGQRVTQLLRVRLGDYDPAEATIRLWDGKGKREQPREHILPLGPLGGQLADHLAERARTRAVMLAAGGKVESNPSLFPSTRGSGAITKWTISDRIREISDDMGGETFDAADVRRSVETFLASLKINRDVRAQLLSHGLTGVQQTHYDKHQYAEEKADALEVWEKFLTELIEVPVMAKVIPLRRRRAA